jgi:hypothetical protein
MVEDKDIPENNEFFQKNNLHVKNIEQTNLLKGGKKQEYTQSGSRCENLHKPLHHGE